MVKMIFVNLPVSDVARSTAFYQAIGAVKNEQFSDHTCSCIAFSDTIQAMLMTHDKYRYSTSKTIADPRTMSGVLTCLFVDSRQAVDDMIGKAKTAGGKLDPSPVDDFDFMYGRSFEDPDGHMWGCRGWMPTPRQRRRPRRRTPDDHRSNFEKIMRKTTSRYLAFTCQTESESITTVQIAA